MADREFLAQLDALFDSLDWTSRSDDGIDKDIQTIVFRALDVYLSARGPRPPIPKKRGAMPAAKPRPPIPHSPVLLYSLYLTAAMYPAQRTQGGKRARTQK